MAKSVGRVQIQLEALTERFQREISKANKTNKRMAAQMKKTGRAARGMSREMNLTARASTSMSAALKRAGAAAAGFFAFSQITKVLRQFIDNAADAELATRKLETALGRGGAQSAQTLAVYREQAQALDQITAFSETQITDTQRLLTVFGVVPEKMDAAVRSTLDLAVALGMPLEGAARQLGKTLGGTLGELADAGPEFQGLGRAALEAGAAFEVAQEVMGGFAESELDTLSGQIRQLGAAWEFFSGEVGASFTTQDQVSAVFKNLDDALRNTDNIDRMVESLESFAGAVLLVHSALKTAQPFMPGGTVVALASSPEAKSIAGEVSDFLGDVGEWFDDAASRWPTFSELIQEHFLGSDPLFQSLFPVDPQQAARERILGESGRGPHPRQRPLGTPAPDRPPSPSPSSIFAPLISPGDIFEEVRASAVGSSADEAERNRQRAIDNLMELSLAEESAAERFERILEAQDDLAESKADQFKELEGSVMSIASAFETQLVSAIMTGKFSFEDFARSVLASIAQMIARMLVLRAVTATLGAFMGGQPGDSFGQTIQSPTGSTGAWQGPTFGTGGVVSGRQQVIVGEAGPEAILPMVRRGGKLGVIAAATSGDSEAPSVLPLIRERGLLAVASPSPDLSLPDLPEFATGGVVSGRQQVVVGEAGPEAILPMVRRGGKLGVIAAATSGDSEAPSVLPLIRERGLLAVAPPSPDLSRPDLPEFAMGGVVSGRQQVIVGEAGPEAILPMVRRGGKLGVIAAATSGDSEAPSVLPLIRERGLLAVAPPSPDLSLPDLPEFAMGGVVSGRQQVIVGEAGPEAILPLARRGGKLGVIASPGGGASAPSVNVTIHNAAPHSEPESEQLANMVSRAVRDAWRQQAINESRPGGFFNPVA